MTKIYMRLFLLTVVAALVVSGCGSAAVEQSPTTVVPLPTITRAENVATGTPIKVTDATSASTISPCANIGTPIALPADFPASFPLPPGTVITGKDAPNGGVLITAVTPFDARSVTVFLERELPARGFKSANGEAEKGEAESSWAGAGFQGRWKVRDAQECAGTATLEVFASK